MKQPLFERVIYAVAVLIVLAEVFVHNPLRFHQTVQVGGMTMQVPVLWTPVKNPGGNVGILVGLRREWARSATVDVVDRAAVNPTGGAWTQQTAEHQRGFITLVQLKDPRFTDPKFFEVSAGVHNAVCVEADLSGRRALTCYLVGTRLQFSYLGSSAYEPDARKMLASLR